MEAGNGNYASNIELGESSKKISGKESSSKGKTPVIEAPLIGSGKRSSSGNKTGGYYQIRSAANAVQSVNGGMKRGISVIDFVLRLGAIIAVLTATIIMGTTEETLPFFTQFFQFEARYDDLPTFTFFVAANAVSAGYLILSLPISIVSIVRPFARAPRLILIALDAVALTLTTSAAGASAAIVYVAHKGNVNANWVAICQQFNSFCERTSGAVVASFIGVVLLVLLVILSAVALRSH